MAIVGTAYVRLRVIGDKLKGDIADATRRAVNDAGPDLRHSGDDAGHHVTEGMTDTVEREGREGLGGVADEIGDLLGNAMGNALGRSLRRRMKDSIIRIRGDVDTSRRRVEPVFDRMGRIFGQKSGNRFGTVFKDLLVSGIGLAVIAAPSILAFLGAAIGAVAATAVTALSTIGPAAAGAGLAAIAAFANIKIATGLIGLAMKQQTPQLLDFQDRMEKFKTSIATPIQGGMLSGFNAALRIAQPIIRGLQPQLKDLGNTVGDLAIAFADTWRQAANLERLQRILTVNNDFIRMGGNGVSSLATAFSILLDHLSPITLFIGQLVQDFGIWAVQALLAAEASGRLDTFITTMFDSLRYFVGILADFGIGIWNVFSAAHDASGGMLQNLHDNAAAFREWTGDPANQERMVRFFERMRSVTAQVVALLRDIGSAAAHGLESTNVERFTGAMDSLRSLGAPLARMFQQIQDAAGPKLQEAFLNFIDMITQMANSGVLGTVVTALSNLFLVISQILQIPGIGPLLAFGAGLFAIFRTLSLLWTIFGPILQVLWILIEVVGGALVAAFGWIPVVIGLVIAALVWFFTQTEIGRHIIEVVWNAIKAAIGAAVDWIVGAWNWLVDVFKGVWQWISDIATAIWQAISTAFNAVVDAVVTAFTTVRDWIVGVWTAIWGFIQPILQAIWNVITTVFNAIRTVIETILNIIYEIWIRVWPLLALPIRILYGVLILIFQAIWDFISFIVGAIVDFVVWAWNGMVSGITIALQAIWDFIQWIWNSVWGFVQPIIQAIWDFIVERWNNLVNNVTAVLQWLWNMIVSIWNGIWGFIQPILKTIGDFISGIWNGIVDGVSTALDTIWDVIKSVWDSITGFIQTAMDTIGDIIGDAWDFIAGVGEAVLDGIKTAINFVIDVINTIIDGINWAIDLANKLPGPDIPNIPTIPRLARGGVVPASGDGMLSLIGEAGRPERVEPLDPSGLSVRDRALIRELAGSGSGGGVAVYIGTRELTELVDFVVEDREDRLADRITTGTKG